MLIPQLKTLSHQYAELRSQKDRWELSQVAEDLQQMETPRSNSDKRTLQQTLLMLIKIRLRLSTLSEKTRAHSQACIKAISVKLSISVEWALRMWSKCSTFSLLMNVTVRYLHRAPINSPFLRTGISRKSLSSLTQAFLENPLKDQIDH